MEISSEEVKNYVEIAKPFVDPIISTILKPQLAKIAGWLKSRSTENKVVDNHYENKFESYLNRTYQASSIINTLVFPNQQINIKDIYYPLTLVSSKDRKEFSIKSTLPASASVPLVPTI